MLFNIVKVWFWESRSYKFCTKRVSHRTVVGHRQFHLSLTKFKNNSFSKHKYTNIHLIDHREGVLGFRFRPSLVREAMEVGKDVFPILGEVLVNTTLDFLSKTFNKNDLTCGP